MMIVLPFVKIKKKRITSKLSNLTVYNGFFTPVDNYLTPIISIPQLLRKKIKVDENKYIQPLLDRETIAKVYYKNSVKKVTIYSSPFKAKITDVKIYPNSSPISKLIALYYLRGVEMSVTDFNLFTDSDFYSTDVLTAFTFLDIPNSRITDDKIIIDKGNFFTVIKVDDNYNIKIKTVPKYKNKKRSALPRHYNNVSIV